MRKFKHSQTGQIVNKMGRTHDSYYQIPNTNYTIPVPIVENSNDWEEIYDTTYLLKQFRMGEKHLAMHKETIFTIKEFCNGTYTIIWGGGAKDCMTTYTLEEIKHHFKSGDWEELTSNEERITYPIGTKVKDTHFRLPHEYEKTKQGWQFCGKAYDYHLVNEDQIGEGKRFQLVIDRDIFSHIVKPKEEKRWRITTFRKKGTNCLTSINNNKGYAHYTVEDYLSDKTFEIYSVEVRVKDSGKQANDEWIELKIEDDYCHFNDYDDETVFYKIGNFSIIKDQLFVDGLPVNKVIKSKSKPLFQLPDENGKMIDVYKEDKIYLVGLKIGYPNNDRFFPFSISGKNADATFDFNYHKDNEWCKAFATIQAAQQYIDLNKKIYSKQDVNEALDFVNHDLRGLGWERFKAKLHL